MFLVPPKSFAHVTTQAEMASLVPAIEAGMVSEADSVSLRLGRELTGLEVLAASLQEAVDAGDDERAGNIARDLEQLFVTHQTEQEAREVPMLAAAVPRGKLVAAAAEFCRGQSSFTLK
jgi:hypothetical protein